MPISDKIEIDLRKFPADKGSYVLFFYLSADCEITAGRLGKHNFLQGYYAYSGNAFGPGGIQSRLKHHLRITNEPHWHVDWLRKEAGLFYIHFQVSRAPLECAWTQLLRAVPGTSTPVPGFGASDCVSHCPAHLVFTTTREGVYRWLHALDEHPKDEHPEDEHPEDDHPAKPAA